LIDRRILFLVLVVLLSWLEAPKAYKD